MARARTKRSHRELNGRLPVDWAPQSASKSPKPGDPQGGRSGAWCQELWESVIASRSGDWLLQKSWSRGCHAGYRIDLAGVEAGIGSSPMPQRHGDDGGVGVLAAPKRRLFFGNNGELN